MSRVPTRCGCTGQITVKTLSHVMSYSQKPKGHESYTRIGKGSESTHYKKSYVHASMAVISFRLMVVHIAVLEDIWGHAAEEDNHSAAECLQNALNPHTYVDIYTHTRIISMYTYMHACMHACMHTYIRTYIHVQTHTNIGICMYTERERGICDKVNHVYIYIYIHIYMHAHIPVETHLIGVENNLPCACVPHHVSRFQ